LGVLRSVLLGTANLQAPEVEVLLELLTEGQQPHLRALQSLKNCLKGASIMLKELILHFYIFHSENSPFFSLFIRLARQEVEQKVAILRIQHEVIFFSSIFCLYFSVFRYFKNINFFP
jgi:hypothetical protein